MKMILGLMFAASLVSTSAFAALSSAEVEAAIEYCLTHGISSGDPIEVEGAGDEVGTVVCVFPDINASLDPPAYIGVKKILLVTE